MRACVYVRVCECVCRGTAVGGGGRGWWWWWGGGGVCKEIAEICSNQSG